MATKKEEEQDNALSKVARSVGSALGTVASKVNDLVGDKPTDAEEDTKTSGGGDQSSGKSEREPSKPASSSTASARTKATAKKAGSGAAAKGKSKASQIKKIKRDKHRRKLGRKTRG